VNSIRKILLVSVPAFCVFYCISQTIDRDKETIAKSYGYALSLYQQSFHAKTEAEEEALNKKSLQLFKALLAKNQNNAALKDTTLFNTHFTIGELEHYFENYKSALHHYAEALTLQRKSSLPDSVFLKPLIYSGLIYYQQNNINKAAMLFRQADAVQNKYAVPLQESQRLYNTLGVINFETGNYRQAKLYFQKALQRLSPGTPYFTDLFVNYKINLAQIHFKLEEYEEADRIYKEVLPLEKNTDDIYHNLGLISLKLGAATTALSYLKKVNLTGSHVARIHNSIGTAYLALKQYDSARHYLTKAVGYRTGENADLIGLGLASKSYGDLEVITGNPEAGLKYYTSAIHQFYPAYSDTAVTSNPKTFTGVFSYINLFQVLLSKAEAIHRIYQKTNSISRGEDELKTYQSAFSLIEYVQRTYNSDEARLFINRSKYEVHSKPIDLAYELYLKTGLEKYLHALYVLDQQNKASVLVLNQQIAEEAVTKDSTLLNKESALKTAITRMSLQAAELTDTIKRLTLHNSIRDLEVELASLQSRNGHALGSTAKIPTVKFLQEEFLDASTTVISYHLSQDKLTIVTITKEDFTCLQEPLPDGFHERVKAYITALRHGASITYSPESKGFFSLLFSKPLKANISRIVIIPDDELLYLPFETLQFEKERYLIEKYTVQYQYSTALLKLQTTNFNSLHSLALAPFADTEIKSIAAQYKKLPYSLMEIEKLEGKKLTNVAATKKAFLENVGNYGIVHLATHARAGDGPGKSFIVFYSRNGVGIHNLLYTEEIYNLSLAKTQLAILSACETGSGNLVRGEGIMSLSRAFTYAGCPNIITSLWKADDFSTAWITEKIHYYLRKGDNIDAAVQQAKVDYLTDEDIHPRLKHPYYWAHLVFIGNYKPATSSHVLIYAIAALSASLIVLSFIKGKKHRAGYSK
jgi:tetratricopeptide (TPR) repeat protein